MSDLLLIVTFFAQIIGMIFLSLDTVKYEGISILDLLCALWFCRLMVWFTRKLIGTHWEEGGEYEEKERPSGGKR